jgi:hypothetical protein
MEGAPSKMPSSVLINAFRALLHAAARFEKKAAKHKRIETERKALADAITQAQLVLSVSDAERSEAGGPSVQAVKLTSVKGGEAKREVASTRQKPLNK